MVSIELNEAEQRLARYIAKKRYRNARVNGVTNGKMGGQSNEQTDLEGIGAEIAFCKIFNVYPDLEIESPENLPDWDCVLHNGKTVDVKSTTYKNGRLLAVKGKADSKTELYSLIVGTFPSYSHAGIATKEELLNLKNLTDLGHGEGFALPQDKLRKER